MEETKLMNQVKEELCYVSLDIFGELAIASQSPTRSRVEHALDPFGGHLKKMFVLPDYQNILQGYVKPDNPNARVGGGGDAGTSESGEPQMLCMETERFSVPEVLFRPIDIGLAQGGVAEATWETFQNLSHAEMGAVCQNIVLTGGNANLKQYRERLVQELRPRVPDVFGMTCHTPDNPDDHAWRGASRFVTDSIASGELDGYMVTKAEYLENGHDYCNKKFFSQW